MAGRNDRPIPSAAPGSPGGSGAPSGGVPPALTRQPAEPSRAFLAAAYTFAVVLGAALGLYGAFLAPAGPRLGGLLLSIGVGLAVVGNGGAALLLAVLTGTRLGACMLLFGWAPVVLWFGSGRPEGDLVLPAGTTSYVFLIAGIFVPVVVSVTVRPTRGLLGPLGPPR
jgi:Family of unknown function (DUF6113)